MEGCEIARSLQDERATNVEKDYVSISMNLEVCSEENVSDKNHHHFAAAKARVSDQRFIEFFDASNLKRYGHTWTHPHSSQGSISQGKCI